MDFSTFDTRTPAEAGAFMQFRHPADGRPMVDDDGEAVGVMLRGMEAKSVQDALKAAQRGRMTGEVAGLKLAAALIIRFVGVQRGGKLLGTTEAEIEWLFGLSGAFEEQIIAFAADRANFFKAASAA